LEGSASVLRSLKNAIVRPGVRYRRVRFGICRGALLPLDLSRQFRWPFGLYEREIRSFVKSYALPGTCCYDIGAGIGYYALALARLSDRGRVYAIEADENACEMLEETVRRNPIVGSRVSVVNAFAASAIDPGRKQVTIDGLVFEDGCEPPDLIKLDIDGGEHEALLGAEAVLRRFGPRLIVEVHSKELETRCQRLLGRYGYEPVVVDQATLFPDYRPVSHNRWICADRPS
jgi:precorrin-6B methylase 2